jgi:hypothetical protein
LYVELRRVARLASLKGSGITARKIKKLKRKARKLKKKLYKQIDEIPLTSYEC